MIPIKPESIPGEFWDTLGKYVYGYKDNHGKWKYIGKGTGSRVFSHTKTKGFDIEDAWIIARNLEHFDEGIDSSCHSMETLLISIYTPADNSVAGRYQENIIMTSLRGLITSYQEEQRNNHFEVAELILRHQESFANIGQVSSTTSGWKITSKSLGRGTYVNVYQADDDGFRVEISVSRSQEDNDKTCDTYEASLKELLGEDEVVRTSAREVSFWCENEDLLVEKWVELTGA